MAASPRIRLWLDDLRPVPDRTWTWAKTVEEAVRLLESRVVDEASLDNDLGMDEPEGRRLVAWMEEHACWPTGRIRVHTANAAASGLMTRAIEGSGLFVPEPGCPRAFVRPHRFDHFVDTVLELDPGTDRSLCVKPGRAPPEPLERSLPFAVVTAWNPMSLSLASARNGEFDERLLKQLGNLGLEHRPAVGRACDEDHKEDGYAVWGLDLDGACELGRNFGQRAIFWISPSGVTVRDCVPAVDLGRDSWRLDLRRLCPGPEAVASIARQCRDFQAGNASPAQLAAEIDAFAPELHHGWIIELLEAVDQRVEVFP